MRGISVTKRVQANFLFYTHCLGHLLNHPLHPALRIPKAESAGIWGASMPQAERMNFYFFVENQQIIEERRSLEYGDKLNELVFLSTKKKYANNKKTAFAIPVKL
ncbi:hypothetical protein B0A75_18510 [Flavobacterium oncorhynchi]|uniref:Uncharacterized protein n=1 Tax=Flavobacterium oncorhynchi TaxID=728056 RepID=A0A226HP04_9FLAO|nr:hypothetical protein B0A75_18510 [Flavobacterium oncorhynchi]